jgi:hypothetical protein
LVGEQKILVGKRKKEIAATLARLAMTNKMDSRFRGNDNKKKVR